MTGARNVLPPLAVAASGILWGLWWIPFRSLQAAGFDGNWANVAVYSMAAVLTAPIAFALRRNAKGHLRALLIIGLLSAISELSWNYALIGGNVIRCTLLFYLTPVWCTVLSLIVFREPVRPLRMLTIAGGLAGAAILVGIDGSVAAPLTMSDGLALAAGVAFAFLTVHVRATGTLLDGWLKTFFTAWIAVALSLAVLAVMPEGTRPGARTIIDGMPALVVCMLWQVVLIWLVMWGSAYLESGRVAIYLLLEVVAAVASAALLAGDPFGWREFTGCVLIVGAGLLEGTRRSSPPGMTIVRPSPRRSSGGRLLRMRRNLLGTK